MNAVNSTVMKPTPVYGRVAVKSSHTLNPSPYDSGYLAEVAAASYALMSNHRAVSCKAFDPGWPREVLLDMFMRAFQDSLRSATLHHDYVVYLNISRTVSALKEWHQLRAFNHDGHTRLTLQVPLEDALPDYSYAFDRLKLFVNEQEDWDGYGGLPASYEVSVQVQAFLKLAQCRRIKVPSLAMGGNGSVAVVWNTDTHYISADFDGGPEYSFFITEADDYITGGASPSYELDSDLIQYLIKYFTDDQYSYL
ncbi:hypothetical protein LT699_10965 [Pseudomonas syringae pv. syringae]|uniref:hypothetical protein n=1 Tax=Pseudomonas syringae TaxID=317 RepID=UPI00200B1933|nr:hypothetical protein [Pseudomonas syringae]MCK9747114.1 hypothetical protein [Pseudomonas syringae pv. syringae]